VASASALLGPAVDRPDRRDETTDGATGASGTRAVIHRNIAWLLMSQIATWAISIVVIVLAPRRLGDAAFGQLAFALTYVTFFGLVASLGTNTYLVKMIARDPEGAGVYVFNTLVLKTVLGLTLSATAIGLALVLGYPGQMTALIAIACFGMTAGLINETLYAGLQGLEQMARPAVWAAVQEYVTAGLGIAVLLAGRGVVIYALAVSWCVVISIVPNYRQLRPLLRGKTHTHVSLWPRIMKGGLPFLLSSAILLIYGSIDIVLLRVMTDNATVGWYSVAYQWVGLPVFFAAVVVTAVFPSLSSHGANDSARFTDLTNRALKLIIFVSAPIAAGTILIAQPFLDLIYPPEFHNAIPLMAILAVHIPIVGLDMVLGSMLIARDRQVPWLVVGCIAAVANPLLNLVLIPRTESAFSNGAIGAAIVTVFTEVLMLVGALILRPAGVFDRSTTRFVLRTAAAALAMMAVVFTLRNTALPAQVAVGILAYGLFSLVVRTIRLADVRQGTYKVRDALHLRSKVPPLEAAE
jgi:O-antigen/teichoic acid export membrane protein